MISVVIPTRNRPDDLIDCLSGLASQTATDIDREVIVVDDYSSKPYGEIVERFAAAAGLHVIQLRNDGPQGAASARNVGARAARGEIIAFLDDDAIPNDTWLAALTSAFDDHADAVTGRVTPRADAHGLFSRARQLRYDSRQEAARESAYVSFLAGGNCAVHRNVFLSLAGFDPAFTLMHDQDFVFRLGATGGRCRYAEEMVIRHRHYKSFWPMIVQTLRSARFRVCLERRHSLFIRWQSSSQVRSWGDLIRRGRRLHDLLPALAAVALEALHASAYLVHRELSRVSRFPKASSASHKRAVSR